MNGSQLENDLIIESFLGRMNAFESIMIMTHVLAYHSNPKPPGTVVIDNQQYITSMHIKEFITQNFSMRTLVRKHLHDLDEGIEPFDDFVDDCLGVLSLTKQKISVYEIAGINYYRYRYIDYISDE